MAISGKSPHGESGRNKRNPLPRVATGCRGRQMVRRGSTVRVRQRALQKPRTRGFSSPLLADPAACGRYGAHYGALRLRRRPFRDENGDESPSCTRRRAIVAAQAYERSGGRVPAPHAVRQSLLRRRRRVWRSFRGRRGLAASSVGRVAFARERCHPNGVEPLGRSQLFPSAAASPTMRTGSA